MIFPQMRVDSGWTNSESSCSCSWHVFDFVDYLLTRLGNFVGFRILMKYVNEVAGEENEMVSGEMSLDQVGKR